MAPVQPALKIAEKKLTNQSGNKKKRVEQADSCRKFQIYSLRSLPITAHRLIVSINDILPDYTHVPFDLEVSQKDLHHLLQAYTKPLLEGGKPQRSYTKAASMKNLLLLLQGAELTKLRAYILSPFFTFCYFSRKHRDDGEELTDTYNRIKNGKVPANTQILSVAKFIVNPGEMVKAERIRSVFRHDNSKEMKELFNSYETLLDEVTEEDEALMKYYFRCFEIETPIERPKDEFVIFRNKAGVPLYVRGRELLTLDEIEAREGVGLGEHTVDHEVDVENQESEEVTVEVDVMVRKFEEIDSGDDENNSEETDSGDDDYDDEEDDKGGDECYDDQDSDNENVEHHVEESDSGEDEEEYHGGNKDMYIEDNEAVDIGDEEEIEIVKEENIQNLAMRLNHCALETSPPSVLESSSTTTCRKSFEKYFDSERRSDAKFVFIDGRCIHVHTMILEHESDAFTDLFSYDVSVTSPGIVNIKDIDYEVMYETIRFIYTGKVYNLEDFAVHLLGPAKRFMLDDLKILCEQQLSEKLLLENVIESLILAEDYDLCTLKEQAKQIAVANMKDIVHLAKFEDMLTHRPKIALEIIRFRFV